LVAGCSSFRVGPDQDAAKALGPVQDPFRSALVNGYKSLGAGSATISKAQHCRAEVFLKDHGWVAMDPADVTKVAREETSEWLKIDHPLVEAVRPKLFGGWEGNWLAYNTAHDVALPGATQGGRLAFFMYPQSETAQGRRDSLDPDTFKYTITSREIKA